jgi:hypothetical protein
VKLSEFINGRGVEVVRLRKGCEFFRRKRK